MKTIQFMGKRDDRKMKNKQILNVMNIIHSEQTNILQRLYLNDCTLENSNKYLSEITRKRSGYIQQDKKNGIYHNDFIINMDDLILKMVESKMKCFYCIRECMFLYREIYTNNQWTLDRIDNNLGHTNKNTVICCLKCNLSRGNINHDRFVSSKQISVVRKIE